MKKHQHCWDFHLWKLHCWKTKKCNGKNRKGSLSIVIVIIPFLHKNLTSTSCRIYFFPQIKIRKPIHPLSNSDNPFEISQNSKRLLTRVGEDEVSPVHHPGGGRQHRQQDGHHHQHGALSDLKWRNVTGVVRCNMTCCAGSRLVWMQNWKYLYLRDINLEKTSFSNFIFLFLKFECGSIYQTIL